MDKYKSNVNDKRAQADAKVGRMHRSTEVPHVSVQETPKTNMQGFVDTANRLGDRNLCRRKFECVLGAQQ